LHPFLDLLVHLGLLVVASSAGDRVMERNIDLTIAGLDQLRELLTQGLVVFRSYGGVVL
jgi:hypothetical protein